MITPEAHAAAPGSETSFRVTGGSTSAGTRSPASPKCRDYVEADGDGDGESDGDAESDGATEPDGDAHAESDGDADGDTDGDGDADGDAHAESDTDGDGDGDTDGATEPDGGAESDGGGSAGAEPDGGAESDGGGSAGAEPDGVGESAGGSRNGDGDGGEGGDGDEGGGSGGDGWLDVTVQRKLTEPVAPDEDVAVTVTSYVPDAVGDMVPVISPLLLIDKPGGRSDAANCGDCPSAALSDVTCNWTAVLTAFCWLPGSSSRTAACRK
jgi:hypothetical protein